MATSRRRRSKKKQEETLVDLLEAKDQAQSFIERNQKIIFGALTTIVVLAGLYLAFTNLYKAPRETKAMDAMYEAQLQFRRDSFSLALTNPGGGNDGFLDIAKSYGNTRAGNLAEYYSGLCWLYLGKYEAALEHFKDFTPAGEILPITKFGAMGDAYSEMNDQESAIKYYKKALSASDNKLLSPYYMKKLGMLYEFRSEPKVALEYYQSIKKEYPGSAEAADIDKYIGRLES